MSAWFNRISVTGAVGLWLLGASASFGGADTIVEFDVPAGDLADALTSISREGSVSIAYASELTQGLRSGPLHERNSVRGALSKVLAGTGLRPVFDGNRVTIERTKQTAAPPPVPGITTDIADIDVSGNGGGNPYQDNGFQAGDSGTSLRIGDTPTKEVPRTISTVTKDVLKAQAVTNVATAVQNVSSVNLAPGQLGQQVFTIRGFQNNNGVFVDGFYAPSPYSQIPIDDVERVDVLKGPTSILTGQTTEGGAIVAETKKPTDTTIRNVTVRYGSYNYATLAFDLGGRVPQTEGLTYRFNISGNMAEKNYAGYLHPHEDLVSPALQWKDAYTSILIGLRYYDQRVLPGQYTYIPGNATTDMAAPELALIRGIAPVNPNLGAEVKTISLYSDQSHQLGTFLGIDTSVNNSFNFSSATTHLSYFAYNTSSSPIGGNATIYQINGNSNYQTISDRSDITLKYDAGFAKQSSKFGFDFRVYRADTVTDTDTSQQQINPFTGVPVLPIFVGPRSFANMTHSITNDLGVYYLEKFDTLNDRLHILGQVRNDTNTNGVTAAGTPTIVQTSGVSWTAGGAFDLFPWMTLYGNRSAGYSPQYGTTNITNLPFPPQQRDNSEAGARFFLFDKNLTLTTAFFDLRATNVAQLVGDGTSFIILPGKESRGFEIEAQGQVFAGLNITAAFSDVNVQYQSSQYTFPLPGVPQFTGNLFATYTVQGGPLQGLTFGGGAHGNSKSLVALSTVPTANSYNLPGYIVADAVIGYTHGKYSLDLKMNNLFNKYFFYPAFSTTPITIGQGRNFLLTGRYAFD